ncbi:MAG: VTT domain-containing protein [Fimbriimonadaceae bacterium]|nr:VTT domain-containing protein [Fimbriimonadaceae bacterium]QYK58829.1 MAG: VTT domain-containing protein [Fimbriimonadaceae bacterium]
MPDFSAIFGDLDGHLGLWAGQWGPGFYVFLFAYGFFQTGLVIGPLAPGNSVFFAIGVFLGGAASVNPVLSVLCLALGATVGHLANYGQGLLIGRRLFELEKGFLNTKNMASTEAFFEAKGRTAMVAAPFVPFVRSFAPFVAGVGRMKFGPFVFWGTVGAFTWAVSLVAMGYFLGAIPFVKDNLGAIVVALTFAILLKLVWEAARRRPRAVPEAP